MNNSPLVQLENVSRIYQQGKVQVAAVTEFSLTVQAGEFSVLCGPSGSGKTTILNMIGALDEPTLGKVRLEGRDLAELGRSDLARLRRDRIGFVFQAYNLNPVLTASVNSAAGVVGKMISLSSIAVAVAATGMAAADESRLFRFTIKHSILLMVAVGILSMLYAYVFPGAVPTI